MGQPNPPGPIDQARQFVDRVIPGADTANAVVDAVEAMRRWIGERHNWVRLGWFAAGLAMIYIGGAALARPAVTSAVRSAPVQAATGAARAGAQGVRRVVSHE